MKKILFLFSILAAHIFYAQSDCVSAIPVCGTNSISYNPNSAGNIAEPTNPSCLADEHYSVWYTFTAASNGTLGFTIAPNTVPGVSHYDYDFALYGPNFNCTTGNYGTPISCNFSGASGNTGLSGTQTGSQWNPLITVEAGQTYTLLIDNYIPSNPYGFVLTWEGSSTLTSPFNTTLQPNPFIAPGPNHDGHVQICASPQMFDFSTLSAGILNNNPNFTVNYYTSSNNAITNTNPITAPTSVNTTDTYYYAIAYSDPTNPANTLNQCRQYGTIKFDSGAITVMNPTVLACNNNGVGIGTFDLTSGVVYNDPTATIKYYPTMVDATAGSNEIMNPTAYVSQATQVFAKVTTTLGCSNIATITLAFHPPLPLTPVTLKTCNNNNMGVGTFDLTAANVYAANPNAPKRYFPSLADLLANTNQIANPLVFTSAEGTVYAEVTGTNGCKNYVAIKLEFFNKVVPKDAGISQCFLPTNDKTALFDLTSVTVNTVPGTYTKKFYPSMQDAVNGTNEITNPTAFVSSNTAVFVRLYDANGCYGISKITLTVIPPVYSLTLKDKIICVEDRTTLDAGPGFAAYMWSTGANTQTITNVSVGEYWVDLTTEGCVTRQKVKVIASPSPVITNLEISNNTVTLTVEGGTKPYQFSLDGVVWQDSNVFNNVPRGQNVIYIKDAYDCDPIITAITVPNLVNAITPNGDSMNDYVDYSALAYKKNVIFSIFDRYGNKINQADKSTGYKWNGTHAGGKKVNTGTYWYSITWEEPGTNIPVKYTGWVMVKNRE